MKDYCNLQLALGIKLRGYESVRGIWDGLDFSNWDVTNHLPILIRATLLNPFPCVKKFGTQAGQLAMTMPICSWIIPNDRSRNLYDFKEG